MLLIVEIVHRTVEILSPVFLSLFVILVDSGGNTCCTVEIIPTTFPQIPHPSCSDSGFNSCLGEIVEVLELFLDDSITYTDVFCFSAL
jgi:hypothetical protein